MSYAIAVGICLIFVGLGIFGIRKRRQTINAVSAFLALPENKAGVTSEMVCDALDLPAAAAYVTLSGMVDRGEIASEHRGRRRYYWVTGK